MIKRNIGILVCIVVTAGAGLATSSLGAGQFTGPGDAAPGQQATLDARPIGTHRIDAKTLGPGRKSYGVLTYRNANGRLCLATGPLDRAGRDLQEVRGKAAPLEEVGNCTFRPDPVGMQITDVNDDPTTPGNERMLVVSGLAAMSVDKVAVDVGDRAATVTPGENGSFIVVFAGAHHRAVDVVATRDDGKQMRVTVPAGPSLDEIAASANRSAEMAKSARHRGR